LSFLEFYGLFDERGLNVERSLKQEYPITKKKRIVDVFPFSLFIRLLMSESLKEIEDRTVSGKLMETSLVHRISDENLPVTSPGCESIFFEKFCLIEERLNPRRKWVFCIICDATTDSTTGHGALS
jgi:hypothetical protein